MSQTQKLYGINSVQAALEYQPERVKVLYLDAERRDRKLQKLAELAQDRGISVQRQSRSKLDRMTQQARHQGVVIDYVAPKVGSDKQLLDLLDGLDHAPFLLILDGVQDPHNLGACLRSAEAAGVDAVIVPKDKAVGLTPTVSKVAVGSAERVPFFQVTNLGRALKSLQDRGIWIAGLTGHTDTSVYEHDFTGPLAVAMGGEGPGLRSLTLKHCDYHLRIPMGGEVESLNVSVATGIVLFEARRQRLL